MRKRRPVPQNTNTRRFCIVSPNFFRDVRGGTEIQTYFLGKEFVRRGWDVYFIRESREKRGQKEQIEGMTVFSLPPTKPPMTWMNTSRIFKIMKSIDADVYYIRAARSYLFSVWFAARCLGGTTVWACSSDVYVGRRLGREPSTWNPVEKLILALDKRLFLYSLRKIDLVCLQSYKQQALLKEHWEISGSVVRNGYPIVPYVESERKPQILWVGNLRRMKHPEKFIALAESFKNRPYLFKVIGKQMNFPFIADPVLAAARDLSHFEYLGEKNPEELLQLYRKSKLLVHTGDYEGFPNVFIESWLCGVPVVSLNVDPDGMIMSQNIGRLSVSMEKLIEDVGELMENEKLWKVMSKNARRTVERSLNIEVSVDTLLGLIENIQNSRSLQKPIKRSSETPS